MKPIPSTHKTTSDSAPFVRRDLSDSSRRVEALQRQLRELQGSQTNKLKIFGSWVPELIQSVEQAAQRGKFHQKPVGPIGKNYAVPSSIS